CAKGFGEGW
nr:immunoglobulin heavy chain junction region [Homo sapiens]MOP75617.1 immunoglobulin heavy chain junction region [Homo sapiens]